MKSSCQEITLNCNRPTTSYLFLHVWRQESNCIIQMDVYMYICVCVCVIYLRYFVIYCKEYLQTHIYFVDDTHYFFGVNNLITYTSCTYFYLYLFKYVPWNVLETRQESTYKITLRSVRVTIVPVKNQQVLNVINMCLYSLASYPTRKSCLFCVVLFFISSLSGSNIFFHVIS